jgi:hypothetical protein
LTKPKERRLTTKIRPAASARPVGREQAGYQAHQSGLGSNHAPYLPWREAHSPQSAQLPAALQLQGHQSAEHPYEGYDHGQYPHHRGNGEAAVKHFQRGFSQVQIGADAKLLLLSCNPVKPLDQSVNILAGHGVETNVNISPRVTPMARSVPISWRHLTTEKVMVL